MMSREVGLEIPNMATVATTSSSEASPTMPGLSILEPPGDDILYEIVENQIRELPPMGVREVHLASTLFRVLSSFAWDHGLGQIESEMLFLLIPRTNLQCRPDLALVSFDRWPRGRPVPKGPAWEVVPNLAIEIVSPKNLANEVMQKIEDYFLAGVQRVWVIYPEISKVYDYDSPTSVQILTPDQTLEGRAVLPGWQIRLSEIFETDKAPA